MGRLRNPIGNDLEHICHPRTADSVYVAAGARLTNKVSSLHIPCGVSSSGHITRCVVWPPAVNSRQAWNVSALSFFGQEHYFIPKSALEVSADEREREFEKKWDAGGFAYWLSNYQDMFFDPKANDLCADYIKRKIRSTVKDPRTAEKLIPKGRHTGGDLRAALGRVKAKTFVMPMSSDMFFSPADCQGRVEAPNPMPNFGRFRPSMGILRYLVLIRMR